MTESYPGWSKILSKLDIALKACSDEPRITTLKEKFGSLRVYLEPADTGLLDIVDELENESMEVCERCGAAGRAVNRRGWWTTLCKSCEG
jgi:hypothetical protein